MSTTLAAHRLATLIGDPSTDGPTYRDLTERIRLLIIDGRIVDGTRLPSERELASALSISRTTTTRVYAELRDAGLTISRRGSGSIVQLPFASSTASSLIITPDDADTIALTYSAPVGPPGLGRAFEAAMERLPGLLTTTGYLPDGLPALRELLAEHYCKRGLPTDPDQLVITNGAMGAISLLARALLSPGDRVLVEATSYPHAHDSFVAAGGRLSPLPLADSPGDVDALAESLAGGRHRLAYFIPEFHNPTSAVMSHEERAAWAHQLRRYDVIPVVDESLREVNLDGISLPDSYATHDPRALLVGSSSKGFWGGLRVGWIRAPKSMIMPLVQARMMDDLGSSAFDQLVLAELLTDGGQTAAAGRARLRGARDHLLAELATHLPDIVAPCPAGGLNLWVTLPEAHSSRLVSAAARQGLLLTPGPRFFAQPSPVGERHLRLPFTQSETALSTAVQRLHEADDEVRSGRTSTEGEPCETLELIA